MGDQATVVAMQGQPEPVSGDHYFAADPAVASSPSTVTLDLPDLTARLQTDRGVFSGTRIDPGTKLLLLDGARPEPGDANLVDVGCGYGAIAVTLARRAPAATVWAVDVNRRALDLCRANATELGLDNLVVVEPGEVPDDLVVDGLWSNPPIRVGKAALRELLDEWLGRLAPAGAAHLVVARNLGSDSLARWLSDRGWAVDRRASRAGYRLLDVTRTGAEEGG